MLDTLNLIRPDSEKKTNFLNQPLIPSHPHCAAILVLINIVVVTRASLTVQTNMHFAIPDTEEIRGGGGGDQKPFTVYNIHINGAFHSSLRYRQLFRLHEQLKKDLSEFTQLPPFPPKKIFALSSQEKEERRVQLERYIQRISQVPTILLFPVRRFNT